VTSSVGAFAQVQSRATSASGHTGQGIKRAELALWCPAVCIIVIIRANWLVVCRVVSARAELHGTSSIGVGYVEGGAR